MSLPERSRWQALSPRVDELLGLAPAQRELRLRAWHAKGDPLAPELEQLLRASDRAQAARFMTGDMSTHAAIAPSLVGQQIGPYAIDALLGEGATGTVWRAHRADGPPDDGVAIKLLHLSLIGRAGALRFQREGLLLARVRHEGIAKLLDAGVTLGGQPYLVLELVEGTRIDAFCDAQKLGVRERVALVYGMLATVAHAHGHRVVHRDIKPNNIHVTAAGQVKLLDFGIAKMLQGEEAESTITASGLRVLTPQYAAPEQINGGAITRATDIYALGVLLYVLVSGRHPLAADRETSVAAVRATLEKPATRLGAVLDAPRLDEDAARLIAQSRGTDLPRLRAELRGDLQTILARTLRKNPAERYQSVSALAEDLRRYLAGMPLSAAPGLHGARVIEFARRFRLRTAALLAVLTRANRGPGRWR